MYTAPKNIYRERVDFAKINTSIPIPNLIEIQKNSYERFLQMRVLPEDREDAGLQSVFKSVFPITDLRENCSLEFVEYSIGNWECKCGRLIGLDKLGRPCTFCGATIITDPRGDREIHCAKCGHLNENTPGHLRHLRRAGRPEAQVRRGRVPGARHDVRRAAQGHDPAGGLGQAIPTRRPRRSATSRSRRSTSATSR